MKKVIKILIVVLILILAIFIGRKIYYNAVGVSPNELYISKENSDEKIKASMGSYQWTDKGVTVIADAISPVEIDYIKALEVKADEKVLFSDDEWTNGSAALLIQGKNQEFANYSIECNAEENYIVVPDVTTGEYIVKVNLESEKGKVWYSFKLNIVD